MVAVCIVDILVVLLLVAVVLGNGFERALPVFAFLVVVLPLEARIEVPGMFRLTAYRIAVATLAVLWVAFGNRAPRSDKLGAFPLMLLMVLYLGWCVVSTLNSVVLATSAKVTLSLILDVYLVAYIFWKSVTRIETVHKVLSGLVAGLFVCCLFGVVERYTGWRVINLFPQIQHHFMPGVGGVTGTGGRLQSTFPHPILFGNALALGVPLALYLLSQAKSLLQRAWLWLAIVLMFHNLYKTMSRGPWLGLALSLVLLFLFSKGPVRKSLWVIGVLVLASLIIRPGVWHTLRNTYTATADPDSPRGSSYQYRYDLMRIGLHAVTADLRRALWGFGPESFYDLGLETQSATDKTVPVESCDSAVVEIMVETGFVGLLLVTALLTQSSWLSLRRFLSLPKPANSLSLVFCISIVAYGFMMLSVENFGWGQQTYMLWILMVLSILYPRLVEGVSANSAGLEAQRTKFPRRFAEAARA